MTVAVVQEFHETREPDPEWGRLLEAYAPANDRVSWLALAWKPGSREIPCQRWVIYEMLPLRLCHPELREALDGPDPDSTGAWLPDQRLPAGRRFVTDSLVSHDQWVVYRRYPEHPAYPLLLWVIQGAEGGHRWLLSPQEEKLLKMMGRPSELPAPGELPYAPFDNRVLEMLSARDRLKKLDLEKRSRDQQSASAAADFDRRAREIEDRSQLLKWLERQVAQAVGSISSNDLRDIVADLPRQNTRYNADEDEVERQFVEGR